METSLRNDQKTPKNATGPKHDFSSSGRTSPAQEQTKVSTPDGSDASPQKSPSSANKIKSFFQDLQRESRHALTNKKAKITQLWEGRRWRRMSLEEVEPFAEMEEKELSCYGETERLGCNASTDDNSFKTGGHVDGIMVENRC